MKHIIRILILSIMLCLLTGCSIGTAADSAVDSSAAATRAARNASYSTQLDAMESLLEGISYGKDVKKALKEALKAREKALSKQSDDAGATWYNPFNRDGDDYCDKFEAAVQKLQSAMNNDPKVREEAERQASIAANKDTEDLFSGKAKGMIKLFLILIVVLLIGLLIVALIAKSAKGLIPSKDVSVSSVHQNVVNETSKELPESIAQQPKLLNTSDSRFYKECEMLGYSPEEVLEFFNNDVNTAKTYISMEISMQRQGIQKNYRQIYTEATSVE